MVVASFAALVSAIGYVILRGALNADTTSTDSLSRGTVHIILQLAVALVLVLGHTPWWLVAVALVTYLVPWALGGSLGTAHVTHAHGFGRRSLGVLFPHLVT